MISFFKKLLNRNTLDYEELMAQGALIVDVRTTHEFAQGHADNSINIPLAEINAHVQKIKKKNKVIITCCRSGARSGAAATILKNAGIEAYNGGSWNQVQAALVA